MCDVPTFYIRFLYSYIQWPYTPYSSTALPVYILYLSTALPVYTPCLSTALPPYITGSNTCLITLFLKHLSIAIGGKGCFRGNAPRYTIYSPALLVTRLKAIYNWL